MHPHKAYQRAERALCSMAAIGVGKSTRSQDGPLNRAAVAKAYLRVENFLSLVQIDALLARNLFSFLDVPSRCHSLVQKTCHGHAGSCDSKEKNLETSCSRGKVEHNCLERFRACPSLVRNWRFLWTSYPRQHRRQLTLDIVRKKQYQFMGVHVCVEAFKILIGISLGALQNFREMAQKGTITIVSKKELGLWQMVTNAPRANKYLESQFQQLCFFYIFELRLTVLRVVTIGSMINRGFAMIRTPELGWSSMRSNTANGVR